MGHVANHAISAIASDLIQVPQTPMLDRVREHVEALRTRTFAAIGQNFLHEPQGATGRRDPQRATTP